MAVGPSRPRNRRRALLREAAIACVLVVYWIGSEVYHSRSISPSGIGTAHDFFDRFGAPSSIHMVKREGESYYEFTGHRPPLYVAAFPSSAPVYVFDELGRYVTWCADPGDRPSHREKWPYESGNEVEVDVVRERLRL